MLETLEYGLAWLALRAIRSLVVHLMMLQIAFEPFKEHVSRKNAYLGVFGGSGLFVFALFLPWASVRLGIYAIDGGSANGWSDGAFWSVIPIAPAIFRAMRARKAFKLNTVLICVAASFIILSYNNIIHRAQWSSVSRPWEVSGSDLDVGFWLGTMALLVISGCLISWTLHDSDRPQQAHIDTAEPNVRQNITD